MMHFVIFPLGTLPEVRYRMGDYEKCAGMYEQLYEDDAEDVTCFL